MIKFNNSNKNTLNIILWTYKKYISFQTICTQYFENSIRGARDHYLNEELIEKFQEKRNTQNMDYPICPWCGHKIEHAETYEFRGIKNLECDVCDKRFSVIKDSKNFYTKIRGGLR